MDLIRAFLTNYLQKSQDTMASQLQSILRLWTSQFEALEQQIKNISAIFDSLANVTERIEDQVQDIGEDIGDNVSIQTKETLDRFYKKGKLGPSIQNNPRLIYGSVGHAFPPARVCKTQSHSQPDH